jgi:hypothetical protein
MANSKRKCRHCKTYALVEHGKLVPLGFFCGIDCMSEYGLNRVRKARRQSNKKELREYRERVKSAAQWKREAQAAFNSYIRYRDRHLPCISCGSLPEQKLGGAVDAGHYRSRGSASHLAFHQHNCHSQCVRCNRYLSGNIVEYRKSLITRIGIAKVEALETNNEARRFDIDYYRRVKAIFSRKLKLKKRLNN